MPKGTTAWAERTFDSGREAVEWFGGLSLFGGQVLRESFRRPFEFTETLRQIFEIGWRSASLIILSGLAVGVVLSMHTRSTLERFGAAAMIPFRRLKSVLLHRAAQYPHTIGPKPPHQWRINAFSIANPCHNHTTRKSCSHPLPPHPQPCHSDTKSPRVPTPKNASTPAKS